jgi:hypothetical protein
MSDTADMVLTPTAPRICAACKWSRHETLSNGSETIDCLEPSTVAAEGTPMTCHQQRYHPSSSLLKQCGVDGILFEAR